MRNESHQPGDGSARPDPVRYGARRRAGAGRRADPSPSDARRPHAVLVHRRHRQRLSRSGRAGARRRQRRRDPAGADGRLPRREQVRSRSRWDRDHDRPQQAWRAPVRDVLDVHRRRLELLHPRAFLPEAGREREHAVLVAAGRDAVRGRGHVPRCAGRRDAVGQRPR